MHEELNTSMMTTEAQADEEEQTEMEQGGPKRMEPKSPGKKSVLVTYPDVITLKIIDAWCNSPHLYKKEHEGYQLG